MANATTTMTRIVGSGALLLLAASCSQAPHQALVPSPSGTASKAPVTAGSHGSTAVSAPEAAVPVPAQPARSAPVQSRPVEPTAAAAEQVTPAAPEEAGARELQADDDVAAEPTPEETAPPEAAAADAAYAASLLHEAVDAYQSAGELWKQGAEGEAIAALDHAYERMAKIPAAAASDPLLGQEKESLRHLISKRVVEIYASRRTAVAGVDGSIQRTLNDDVRYEIASFQNRERDFFLEAYRRSGLYRPKIVAELQKAGMPEALSWLPLVESGFKDRALSSARALGLWQFISSTGYRYGLDRSDWIDERMDPEKSTQGALAYLSALHELFGDWLTALAAYNCGEHAVLRVIDSQRVAYFDRFWDLYQLLPRETRRYVPRFLATIEIVENPEKYGFTLPQPYPALEFDTVEIARAAQLVSFDKALGLESGTLQRLNPELRRNATPRTTYQLKVPLGTGETVLASLSSLPVWVAPPVASTGIHRVRAGETLSVIASKYHTSVAELMRLNRLRSANRLSVGQKLQVPERSGAVSSSSTGGGGGSAQVGSSTRGTSLDLYVVRNGDTLGSIAEDKNVPLSSLLAANDLTHRSMILPGQRLRIPG